MSLKNSNQNKQYFFRNNETIFAIKIVIYLKDYKY